MPDGSARSLPGHWQECAHCKRLVPVDLLVDAREWPPEKTRPLSPGGGGQEYCLVLRCARCLEDLETWAVFWVAVLVKHNDGRVEPWMRTAANWGWLERKQNRRSA